MAQVCFSETLKINITRSSLTKPSLSLKLQETSKNLERLAIMNLKIIFVAFVCSLIVCCSTKHESGKYFVRPGKFVCDYPFNDTSKWVITGRVWGLMKYYHPIIAAGKLDWDKVLLNEVNNIQLSSTPAMVNAELKKMLQMAGDYTYKESGTWNDSLNMNVNLCWIDHSFLDDTLKVELKRIASQSVKQPSYYGISMDSATHPLLPQHEKIHDFDFYSSLNFRLLSLFRYWNVIYYFSPHKYLMDESWDKTLSKSIFPFINANDKKSYQIAFLKLAAALNDGHCYNSFTENYPYMSLDIIEYVGDKTVVRIDKEGLKKGDIIKSIGSRDIVNIRDSLSLLVSASTRGNKEYRINCGIAEMIFFHETNLSVLRNDQEHNIHTSGGGIEYKQPDVYKRISDNIGYVNLSQLTTEKIDSIFNYFSNAAGIIFDLRKAGPYKYNVSQLECHLAESKVLLMPSAVYWDLEHPGAFIWEKGTSSVIPDNVKCTSFKGNLIFLINESTQSFTETQAWIARFNFHAKLIGRPTSGACGQVIWVPLPGNQRAAFSGIGLFSLDGSELQRKGIIPDIEVYPTIESIKSGKDEILEAAIKYLNEI